MEDVISEIVNRAVADTGRIIGLPLAIRLASEEFERAKSMHRELESFKVSGSKITVKLAKGTARKRALGSLETIISCLIAAYSGVIGLVARSIVKKAIDSAAERHGKKYPELKRIAKKIG